MLTKVNRGKGRRVSMEADVHRYITCRLRRQCHHIGLQAMHPVYGPGNVPSPATRTKNACSVWNKQAPVFRNRRMMIALHYTEDCPVTRYRFRRCGLLWPAVLVQWPISANLTYTEAHNTHNSLCCRWQHFCNTTNYCVVKSRERTNH